MTWFNDDIKSIFFNIVGGAIVSVLTYLWVKWLQVWRKRNLPKIFGRDFLRATPFYLVYAGLKLKPELSTCKWPLRKDGPNPGATEAKFNVSPLVGNPELLATNYLVNLFGKFAADYPTITLDNKLNDVLDISWISFGGSLSNNMTRTLENHPANTFLFLDRGNSYNSKSTGKVLFEKDSDVDYGVILKISPPEHPGRVWISCAGIGGWGTSGSAWYLANRWKDLLRSVCSKFDYFCWFPPKNFAVIVEVKIGNDQSAKLIGTYSS